MKYRYKHLFISIIRFINSKPSFIFTDRPLFCARNESAGFFGRSDYFIDEKNATTRDTKKTKNDTFKTQFVAIPRSADASSTL